MSGSALAFSQASLLSSPVSLALLVSTERVGTWISKRLSAGDFASRLSDPDDWVNWPWKVENPMCETLNSTWVWFGSMA